MNSWDWVDEIISQRYTPEMEIPEDILYLLLKKNPVLQELIDEFDLEMEL